MAETFSYNGKVYNLETDDDLISSVFFSLFLILRVFFSVLLFLRDLLFSDVHFYKTQFFLNILSRWLHQSYIRSNINKT